MTDSATKKRDEWILRIGFSVMAIFFAYSFIFKISYEMWTEYWLSIDAKQTTALVTKVRGQGVYYNYDINGKEYYNHSQRNWEHDVSEGQESAVFYSSSHPWLSSVTTPEFQPLGIIVILISLVAELVLVMGAIDPSWAIQNKKRKNRKERL